MVVVAGDVVRDLPTQDLLPVANIHCIFQDSEGFFWYGTTSGGLCRDNGYEVDVFRSDVDRRNLLVSNDVLCIAEDTLRGCIWFGTTGGACILDKRDYQLRRVADLSPEELSTGAVSSIATTGDGRVWLLSESGILSMTGSWPLDGPADSVAVVRTMADTGGEWGNLHVDNSGGLWAIFNRHKIWKWNGEDFEPSPWASDCHPTNMVDDGSDGFWVSTVDSGIVHYAPATGCVAVQPATLGGHAKRRVLSIALDSRRGWLWATTSDDLYAYRISNDTLSAMPIEDIVGNESKLLDGLCLDREGNLYVAGFIPHTFIIAPSGEGIRRNEVQAIRRLTNYPLIGDRVVPDEHLLWISQSQLGLMLYDSEADSIRWQGGTGHYAWITKVADGPGVLDAARGGQVVHLQWDAVGGGVVEEVVVQLPGEVSFVSEGRAGRLLIGTYEAAYSYDTISGTLRELMRIPGKVNDMIETFDGSILAAVHGAGLYKWHEGQVRQLTLPLPSMGTPDGTAGRTRRSAVESVSSLAESRDGRVWAATYLGEVFILEAGSDTLVRDDFLSGLGDGAILDTQFDATGHLWLITNQTVWEVHPQTQAFRSWRNSDPQLRMSFFTHLEECDEAGIGLAGAGAFCLLNSSAELDRPAQTHKAPVLTGIVKGGHRHIAGMGQREVHLDADESGVVLLCSTLAGLHAHNVSMAYQTEGMGIAWQYLPQGANRIYLNNLPHGRTVVRVRATDRYGCWQGEESLFVVYRARYWWQAGWGRCLILLIVVACCAGLWWLNKRIHYLLVLSRLRRKFTLHEVQLMPGAISAAQREEAFLLKVKNIVELNLSDTEYSVVRLCADIGMSRMTLYRKLQSLTGQSPNEFIRDIRLKSSARLLLSHPDLSIAEVADRVGFSSANYFAKCFKAKFGVQPTVYRQSHS